MKLSKRYFFYTALGFSLHGGIFFTALYIYEVWEVLGEADQSVIYWHLPILWIGFGAFTIAGWLYRHIKAV